MQSRTLSPRTFYRFTRCLFQSLLVSLCCLLSVQAAPAVTLKAPRPVVWQEFLGVNAHSLWFSESAYRAQLSKWRSLGLRWVRVDLHWDRLEPAPGQWRLAELDRLVSVMQEQSISPLMYLVGSAPFASSAPAGVLNVDQYPPVSAELFADRMGLLASRYPTVKAWQVWNEPNLPSFWQPMEDPQAYARLLEPSLARLTAANPAAQRVHGGYAYYSQMPVRGGLMLQALKDQGQVRRDSVVAYHPYSLSPEGDRPEEMDFVQYASTLNQYLRQAGTGGIWATEFGWSSYAGPVEWQPLIGEQGQADFLLKRLSLMSALDFDKVFLFALSDLDARATARDQKYGLLRLDGTEKPAFVALKRFLQIAGARLTPLTPPAFADAPAGMLSMAWRRADGKNLWLFWSQVPGVVTLPLPVAGRLYNPLQGSSRDIAPGSRAAIPVERELQMLVW